MLQQELLIKLVKALEGAGINYLLTGSIASSLQGEPRLTHDIDLLVALHESHIDKLEKAFPSAEFYIDSDAIRAAIDNKSMFNLIDLSGGSKIDFWLLTDDPFDRSRFARRIHQKFMGVDLSISTPEDTILAKLAWMKKLGESEKQFTDALRVFEVQSGNLDLRYIDEWAHGMNIEDSWKRLQEQADTC